MEKWVSPESFLNGWRAVGITDAGLDPYDIPNSEFLATGAKKPISLVPPQTPMVLSLPTSMVITRQGRREASLEYEVAALRAQVALLNKLPQGVGELGLFSGAADGVDSRRHRDSRKKRKDFKRGMGGGM